MTFQGPRTEEAGPTVDPSGAPVEDAGPDEDAALTSTRAGEGRVLDRGAIVAAMVGLGVSVTVAISFGLIITLQLPVFLAAPISGVLIGYYANYRSMRYRPRWRVLANASVAGAVTGLSLAVFYIGLRMLFWYADFGFRPEGMGGQVDCSNGIECTYARMLQDEESRQLLVDAGVTDVASFESELWSTAGEWALILIVSTLAGALVAAGWRAVREPPHAAVEVGPTP